MSLSRHQLLDPAPTPHADPGNPQHDRFAKMSYSRSCPIEMETGQAIRLSCGDQCRQADFSLWFNINALPFNSGAKRHNWSRILRETFAFLTQSAALT